ncbi:hypothetical protein CR513_24428, partial [Mucuna pruriens]
MKTTLHRILFASAQMVSEKFPFRTAKGKFTRLEQYERLMLSRDVNLIGGKVQSLLQPSKFKISNNSGIRVTNSHLSKFKTVIFKKTGNLSDMKKLEGPNQSDLPTSASNCSDLLTSSRTKRTFFFWRLCFIIGIPRPTLGNRICFSPTILASKTARASVVLPIPPIPHIPTIWTPPMGGAFRSQFSSSIRYSRPIGRSATEIPNKTEPSVFSSKAEENIVKPNPRF